MGGVALTVYQKKDVLNAEMDIDNLIIGVNGILSKNWMEEMKISLMIVICRVNINAIINLDGHA